MSNAWWTAGCQMSGIHTCNFVEKDLVPYSLLFSSSSFSPSLFLSFSQFCSLIQRRFAFLDLTAGPFEWGPIIGGEGVRSKGSIPNVPFRPEWRDSSVTLPEGEGGAESEPPSLAADMERYRSELALLEAYKNSYCSTPEER